jgi:hypothetical protein
MPLLPVKEVMICHRRPVQHITAATKPSEPSLADSIAGQAWRAGLRDVRSRCHTQRG